MTTKTIRIGDTAARLRQLTGRHTLRAPFILLLAGLLCLISARGQADALIQSQAMSASAIAQYFVEPEIVRLELEIGMESLEAFRNLLPDEIYTGLNFGDEPWGERLVTFTSRDMPIYVDNKAVAGRLIQISPSKRVLRDPINGTPLPVQDGAPDVLRATLEYRFEDNPQPAALGLGTSVARDIGFVVYHRGVAVNDYRYLARSYTLNLDWQDPWYSRFNSRSLQRQYDAPMSGFIYVEPFEVRKEIIVRPKDLQRWVDLGLDGIQTISVEAQGEIKERVARFLAGHHPVTIDGVATTGEIDSVNFLERTLTSSRVIDPPVPLDVDSAIIGTIFIYPRNGLPQKVTMDWDLWDQRIQRVPVSAVDQAGPLPSFLEPDWSELVWENFLKNPFVPTLNTVEAPVELWRIQLSKVLPFCYALTLAALVWLLARLKGPQSNVFPAVTLVLLLVITVAARELDGSNQPGSERARAIVADLLHNIYRAFDYRDEGDIYDVLQHSVSGELLTDIFLETKRSLVLANQGGARAKVKNISLEDIQIKPDDTDNQFTAETTWTVHGSVGHWGHVHQRNNRYQALLSIAVDDDQWKLQKMTVLQEERL